MGNVAFFYTGGIDDLVTACLDLALVYQCNPYVFLDRSAEEVMELYRLTNERLKAELDE